MTKLGMVKDSVVGIGKVAFPIVTDIASFSYEQLMRIFVEKDRGEGESEESDSSLLDVSVREYSEKYGMKVDDWEDVSVMSDFDVDAMDKDFEVLRELNSSGTLNPSKADHQGNPIRQNLFKKKKANPIIQADSKLVGSGREVDSKISETLKLEADNFAKENKVIEQLKEQRVMWQSGQDGAGRNLKEILDAQIRAKESGMDLEPLDRDLTGEDSSMNEESLIPNSLNQQKNRNQNPSQG